MRAARPSSVRVGVTGGAGVLQPGLLGRAEAQGSERRAAISKQLLQVGASELSARPGRGGIFLQPPLGSGDLAQQVVFGTVDEHGIGSWLFRCLRRFYADPVPTQGAGGPGHGLMTGAGA